MKYNPAKFASAYFAGKLTIAVLGAFLGGLGEQFLGGYMSQMLLLIVSVVLTIAITVVLLKVDLSGIEKRILTRLGLSKT